MVPSSPTPGNHPLPQSVAFAVGHARGVASGGLLPALRPLFELAPGQWPTLLAVQKQTTVRTVLHGRLVDAEVHVKVFRGGKFTDTARDLLTGARGERELRNLLRARELGLPAVEPLAAGVTVDDDGKSRSFLITKTVAGALPFTFDLAGGVPARVGALLRHAHDRGFLPGDLHPGNVVIDEAGAPWLLDLTSVQHRGDPDIWRRAAALAFFCQELDAGPLDPRARVLLRSYLTAGPELPGKLREQLALAARAVRRRALAQFGKRAARACRHTEVLPYRHGDARWLVHRLPETDSAHHAACVAFAAAPPPPDKTGRRGSVWVQSQFVVKQRQTGAARKLWRATYWLVFAKVAQPTPLALRTFDGQGLFFARRLAGPNLATELAGGSGSDAIVAMARTLGRSVGRLHAHGLRNRDLKFENLVRDPATGAIAMVDLDGISRKGPDDLRGQGRDLGRLLAAFRAAGDPGGERAIRAFVAAYLRARWRLLEPVAVRRLWRAAEQRAGEWATAHAPSD